ncbi:metallophosphoesterase [Myxococcus sp. K15C18031901]|uniref:metallophosphoesterase n=1 Tax=Myxococcus dinghuensis TaxID=2906761 RepID=UPI0020A751BA|nr:metallophosphoesterase [Myxococcus dinghuensis]MCP3101517.1 metallophosphoesterase [Myxococcus dinghuensis]
MRWLGVWVLLLGGEATAGPFTREPYLQNVTRDRALIVFNVRRPCAATLRLGRTGEALESVPTSEGPRTQHVLAVKDLQANTAYDYVVEACGASLGPFTFRTAPGPGDAVHFIAVGDSGTGGAMQMRVAEAMTDAAPQLFLALGDNAYSSGTHAEFQSRFFAPLAELLRGAPAFATPGNHEYLTDRGQPYFDNFHLPTNNDQDTERYYSFDWGDAHIVSLDTNCAMGLAGGACSPKEQREWLVEDLRASQARWKLVMMHHPPWSSGGHGIDTQFRETFAPLFEQGDVDLVLTGHDHDYERTFPLVGESVAPKGKRGVTYVVVGTGGAVLRKFPNPLPRWTAVRSDKDYGFLDVRIHQDVLTARLVTPDGGVADEFVLSKRVALTLAVATSPLKGFAPLTVSFTAAPSHEGASIEWRLGKEDVVGTGMDHTQVFPSPGVFEVHARAVLGYSQAEKRLLVEVEAPPTPPAPPPSNPTQPAPPRPPVAEQVPLEHLQETTGPLSSGGCSGLAAAPLLLTLLGLHFAKRRGERERRARPPAMKP